MMIATFALLIIAGLYLAILVLTIVFAVNAKSTAGRVVSILLVDKENDLMLMWCRCFFWSPRLPLAWNRAKRRSASAPRL